MQQLNSIEVAGLDIEDIAKYKVLEMLSEKECLTENDLYELKEDFEDTFIKSNKNEYALEILLLNKEDLTVDDTDKNYNIMLNNNLYPVMDLYLDMALSVYLDKFDEIHEEAMEYDDRYENYDAEEIEYLTEEYDGEPSIYFEDIETQLFTELDFSINYLDDITLESKLEEKISNLLDTKKELIQENISDLLQNLTEEDITEEMAEILIVQNNDKVKNKIKTNAIQDTREYCRKMLEDMKANYKEKTIDTMLEEATEKMTDTVKTTSVRDNVR